MTGRKLISSATQIVLILLASLLVIGVTWQIGQGAESQQRAGQSDEGEHEDHEHEQSERGEGRDGRHEHSDEGEWLTLRGIAGFSEVTVKLVVVISAIVFGQRGWASFQKKRAKEGA